MDKYILQQSDLDPEWWVVTDTENGIVCQFQSHCFNATQHYTILFDIVNPNPNKIASIARGIADFLSLNHYDLAMGDREEFEIPETTGQKGIRMGAFIEPKDK